MILNKQKEDNKRLMEELNGLQDIYDKTSLELTKTKDMEVKLKEDLERTTYDLEMCRERLYYSILFLVYLHNVTFMLKRIFEFYSNIRIVYPEY